jgi:6-phosphogluconolactonase
MSTPVERTLVERMFVYVANADSRELLIFALDAATGDLQLAEHVLGGKFTVLAHTPDRRFMFAALRDEPFGVASFAIDPARGTLRLLGETRLPGPLAFMSVDSTGRWLLTASYHNEFVAVCAIDADGRAREPQQVVKPIPKAHAVIPAPSNRFVVATSLGTDTLLVWPFDASSGRLDERAAQQVKVSSGAGPRHLRFDPRADRLFLVNELDASVLSFDFDAASGRLQERASASAVPKGYRGKRWAAEIQLAPNGKFMYVSERSSSTITALRIDGPGRMQVLGSVATERQPRAMAIDPSGRFLLAAGQKSNRLSVYSIDAESGLLTKLTDYAVGGDPCWISILSL